MAKADETENDQGKLVATYYNQKEVPMPTRLKYRIGPHGLLRRIRKNGCSF